MNPLKLTRRTLMGAGASLMLLSSMPALAELHISITGVGTNQFPIAIKRFAVQGAPEAKEDIAQIVLDDLRRTGVFRTMMEQTPEPVASLDDPTDLKALAADGFNAVLVGVVTKLPDGRWDVRYFLHDAVTNKVITSNSVQESDDSLRMAAHRIADDVYSHLTGEKPMFASSLMYVNQLGPKNYQLVITDSDGHNKQVVLQSHAPIISPVWHKDGRHVAYVSFERQKPVIFIQDLTQGTRRAVSAFEGNNSAPAFSPDGQWMCVALSRGGRTQLWFMSVDGNNLKRFSNSFGIDTEPSFSPDAKYVYFTSDRGGAPQIYRQPVAGGNAERITFGIPYAVSPEISPDGKYLTFVTREDGHFHTAIMDLQTGQITRVSGTEYDESPSFAPNSRYVVYATRENDRGVLATASVDGRVVTRIEGDGNIREPKWGPINQ